MGYNTSIIFGELTISGSTIGIVDRMNFRRVPGTAKQIVGGNIVPKRVPDRAVQDWRGTISGLFYSSTRLTDRDTLQTIRNSNLKVQLTDGIHDGEYYIMDLTWNDDANTNATEQRYTMTILQEQ